MSKASFFSYKSFCCFHTGFSSRNAPDVIIIKALRFPILSLGIKKLKVLLKKLVSIFFPCHFKMSRTFTSTRPP